MKRKYNVGDIFDTNCGVKAQIIEISQIKQYVKIVWLDDFKHESLVKSTHLVKGRVSNPFSKSLYGVGYLGVGNYSPKTHKSHYALWSSMFSRCYSEQYKEKKPTYKFCKVERTWHNFQNFAAWCDSQSGFMVYGCELDKDILLQGNKEYSAENCRFIPRYLNCLLSDSNAIRGDLPIGVSIVKNSELNPFSSYIKLKGKSTYLGVFPLPCKAHKAWQMAKSDAILSSLSEYAESVVFDSKIAEALMCRVWKLNCDILLKTETTKL